MAALQRVSPWLRGLVAVTFMAPFTSEEVLGRSFVVEYTRLLDL